MVEAIVHGHIELVGGLLQYADERVSFLIYYEKFNDNQHFSESYLADKLRQKIRPSGSLRVFERIFVALRSRIVL